MGEPIDVRSLRERLGWTQPQIAEHLEIDRSTIAHAERGRTVSRRVAKRFQELVAKVESGVIPTPPSLIVRSAANQPPE